MLHGKGFPFVQCTSPGSHFDQATRNLAPTSNIRPASSRSFSKFQPGSPGKYPGGVELFYPTARHAVKPVTEHSEDGTVETAEHHLDAWTWGFTGDFRVDEIEGLDVSIRYLVRYLEEHGPFDGK